MSEYYYDDEGELIAPYDQDESYPDEDELCDCGRHHFSHCYHIGCFGNLAKRRYWDWDDDDESDDGDESDDERDSDVPPSDLSDIPF